MSVVVVVPMGGAVPAVNVGFTTSPEIGVPSLLPELDVLEGRGPPLLGSLFVFGLVSGAGVYSCSVPEPESGLDSVSEPLGPLSEPLEPLLAPLESPPAAVSMSLPDPLSEPVPDPGLEDVSVGAPEPMGSVLPLPELWPA